MDRRVFFALVYFAGLVGLVALMVLLLRPFLSSIAWAWIVALAAYPIHRAYLRFTKGRITAAALLSTLTVVLTVAIPLLILAILFAGEAAGVLANLQHYAASGKIPGREQVLANPTVAHISEKLAPFFQGVELKPLLVSAMKGVSTLAVGASKAILLNTFGFLFKFFIMVAVMFFAFRDGAGMAAGFWEMVPLKEQDKGILLDTIKRVTSAVIYGIVLTCIVQGVLGGIGFAIVGLPSPVFFGAVMILCAFIPLVGTALVWVPGVLYLAATGHYGKAIFLAIWGVAVISSIDNFVRPFFISGKAKIPLLVILLGVLGGLASMGFLGVIVGPLVFSLALDIAKVYRTEIFSQLKNDAPLESPAG